MFKRLGIRHKLFIAFLAVVVVPLGLTAYLSLYYLNREAQIREGETDADVQRAFTRMQTQAEEAVDGLRTRVQKATTELEPKPMDLIALLLHRDHLENEDSDVGELLGESSYTQRLRQRLERLKKDEPALRAFKLVLEVPDDEPQTILDDLSPAFDWNPRAIPDSQAASDRPMLVEQERLGRTLLIAHTTKSTNAIYTPTGETIEFPDGKHISLWLIAELDWAKVVTPTVAFRGWAVQFDTKTKTVAHTPEAIAMLRDNGMPALERALSDIPADATMQRKKIDGKEWRIYAAPMPKQSAHAQRSLRLFALMSEEAFMRPLWVRSIILLFGFGFSLGFALRLAYTLSGRFVGRLEALEQGADAIARGDFTAFEQRGTGDEFGRLADSMNRMAGELAQRLRKEEIDGWRRLVRVLSHEINNTLGPVRSVAATVRDQVATRLSDGDAAEDLQLAFRLIIDRTDALTSFIANYAELAKLPDPEKQPTVLGDVVRSAIELLHEPAAQRKVKILDQLDPELPQLPLDRAQLERVVINLVKNAIEAAPAETVVVVRTERSVQGVDLVVEDRGPGISADARRHLFVPYFTTKPGGSGLGLALVRQIVLGHGGSVVAEDLPEGGTRMRVTLALT